MKQPRIEYHIARMWISVLLGIGYSCLFLFFDTLTGSATLDGIIGVLLGLYIGSHPAAHLLDLLYLPQGKRRDFLASEPGAVWLVVNILVLVVGIFTIVIGANRFVQIEALEVVHTFPLVGKLGAALQRFSDPLRMRYTTGEIRYLHPQPAQEGALWTTLSYPRPPRSSRRRRRG